MTLRESVDFLKLTNARLIGQVLDLTCDAKRSRTLLDAAPYLPCYASNATFDHEENRWKAVQFGNIKADGQWYEAVFHARLADKLGATQGTPR